MLYKVLGVKKIAHYFGLFSIVVAFGIVFVMPPDTITGYFRIASISVVCVAFIFFFIGQTAFFPFFCRLPLIREIFPSIEGSWKAELTSNWRTIAEVHGFDVPQSDITEAKVKITARMLNVRIELESLNGYSESETIAASVIKDVDTGEISLAYIYFNQTPVAQGTDSSFHHGAATLKLKKQVDKPLKFVGDYWTNRNWTKGLNTAGRIVLEKIE